MGRDIEQPTVVDPNKDNRETHPAWGMIGASRVQNSPPGAVLFDSDIRHAHTVVVRIGTASRERSLNRDWLMRKQEFVEVEMSEAQWASFVSSMNSGSGVACTIRRREDDYHVPGVPFEPRFEENMNEVRGAANKALEHIKEAFAAVEEKPNKGNIKTLRHAIENAPSNLVFAGESLTEHAENVVQKARADIEAMVLSEAQRLGIEPGDLAETPQLDEGRN